MKLTKRFEALERTAFGPWLKSFKNLFTKKELEQDALEVKKTPTKDDIAVLINTIIEIDRGEKNAEEQIVISDYKKNISDTMLKIEKFALEKFSEFISKLPKNRNEYSDYFLTEEKKDGYSKINAFKIIPDKKRLLQKCQKFDNYEIIEQNAQELETYLNPNYDNLKTKLLGHELHHYGCDNV